MKMLTSYLIGAIVVMLACVPPIEFAFRMPGEYFPWMMVLVIFAGIYLFWLPAGRFVRMVAVLSLLNCFLSSAPLASFISYVWVVAVCYFWLLCKCTRELFPVVSMLRCLLAVNCIFFAMQLTGHDTLLNFGRQICFGVVGQHMQSASFSVILAATLFTWGPWVLAFPLVVSIFCNSAGAFISAVAGLLVLVIDRRRLPAFFILGAIGISVFIAWLVITGKGHANMSMDTGRWGAWTKAIELGNRRWLTGWGIGTFKILFPILGNMKAYPWKTAHNCWIQMYFETGILGLGMMVGCFATMAAELIKLTRRSVLRRQARWCLAGLVMIAVNMCFHFPTRMIQSVLLIVLFLSICQKVVNNGKLKD